MNHIQEAQPMIPSQICALKQQFSQENFFDYDIVLKNSLVRLRPITPTDQEHLTQLALKEDIWAYFALKMSDSQSIKNYLKEALEQRESKLRYTFVIEHPVTKQHMGSTAFGNFSKKDSRIEFGWSWLGKEFQGTGVNSQVKFLLLAFGFDILDLERVEAKTDVLNKRARGALIKVGMTQEGVLRSHTLMPDGRRRDTIYYSMLKGEWPLRRDEVFSGCDFNLSLKPKIG
ncbi:MAG: GNAT family protein [Chlamydiales bacterium]